MPITGHWPFYSPPAKPATHPHSLTSQPAFALLDGEDGPAQSQRWSWPTGRTPPARSPDTRVSAISGRPSPFRPIGVATRLRPGSQGGGPTRLRPRGAQAAQHRRTLHQPETGGGVSPPATRRPRPSTGWTPHRGILLRSARWSKRNCRAHLRAERDDLRGQMQLLARIAHALEIECSKLQETNANLEQQLAEHDLVPDLTRRRCQLAPRRPPEQQHPPGCRRAPRILRAPTVKGNFSPRSSVTGRRRCRWTVFVPRAESGRVEAPGVQVLTPCQRPRAGARTQASAAGPRPTEGNRPCAEDRSWCRRWNRTGR